MIDIGPAAWTRITDEPCDHHQAHTPSSLARVKHLVLPEYLQLSLWGRVPQVDYVPLCAQSSHNVLLALDDLLHGRELLRSYEEAEKNLARVAFNRWHDAWIAKLPKASGLPPRPKPVEPPPETSPPPPVVRPPRAEVPSGEE